MLYIYIYIIYIPGIYLASARWQMTILLLRGTIVNRTYGRHKNQYIYLFSLTIWSYLLWSPVTLTINRVSSDGILVNEDGYGILGGEKEKRTLSRNRGVCVCRHNSTRVNAERRYQRKARNLPSGREGDISCFVTSDLSYDYCIPGTGSWSTYIEGLR